MTSYEYELKNAYIGIGILQYDFTQSDGGWVADSGVSRNSSGFYISETGDYKDKNIKAPSEIYNHGTPSKIIIEYNKSGTNTGTGLRNNASPIYELIVPRNPSNLNYLAYTYNGGNTTQLNLGANPTGDVTWEMNIDSSTTNWTITHKITGCTTVQESSGALKYLFNNETLFVRLVHWTSSGLYIKSIRFEY